MNKRRILFSNFNEMNAFGFQGSETNCCLALKILGKPVEGEKQV